MANFKIDFGQRTIENAQKARQLDLEQQRINNQRDAAAASAAAQGSAAFWNRIAQRDANDLRAKELELREERQDHLQSWEDAINEQKMRESEQRMENLRKMSEKYDVALEEDKAKAAEAVAQAQERKRLLDSEMGTLFLSAQRNGGRVTPSQLKTFNRSTGSKFDFIGNTADIPLQDGRTVHKTIGDGKGFYMGMFERDQKGHVVFGQDGTPVTTMMEMPRELQEMILASAYGKSYLGGGRGGSGMSEERMQLERDKINMREKELAERKAQAAARLKAMDQKLTASIARNFNHTRRGAGMNEEEARQFQTGIKNVLMDMFNVVNGQGGGEDENPNGDENPTERPKGEQQGQARQISSPSEMADAPIGSWFVKGDKEYIKQENGQFLPEE